MIDSTEEKAFRLLWDTDHFEQYDLEENYDLDFSPYPDYEQDLIYQPAEFKISRRGLVYAGYPPVVKNIDYPLPDNRWTVMSRRMYNALLAVGDFPHRLLPTAVVDSQVPDEQRFLSDDRGQSVLRSEVLIGDYLTIQMTRHEDFFDWEQSQFKRPSPHLPDLLDVSEYVLNIPINGLPPLFRLQADPTVLFISAEARQALKRAGITGPRYLSLRGFRDGTGDAVDVPISLQIEAA